MTAKAYNLLKSLKPRIIKYNQKSSDPDDPNARVIIDFACLKKHEKDLEEFIKTCNESTDIDTAEIIGSSVTSIFFKVESDYFFSDNVIKDIL